MRVLLIIPAYNEEENIQRVIQRVRDYRETCGYPLDYVVIDDGSTDSTARICREQGIHHISLLQNLGIGGAVQTGYLYAQREGYDIAVQFDGDGQHDLESLPQLLAPVVRGLLRSGGRAQCKAALAGGQAGAAIAFLSAPALVGSKGSSGL